MDIYKQDEDANSSLRNASCENNTYSTTTNDAHSLVNGSQTIHDLAEKPHSVLSDAAGPSAVSDKEQKDNCDEFHSSVLDTGSMETDVFLTDDSRLTAPSTTQFSCDEGVESTATKGEKSSRKKTSAIDDPLPKTFKLASSHPPQPIECTQKKISLGPRRYSMYFHSFQLGVDWKSVHSHLQKFLVDKCHVTRRVVHSVPSPKGDGTVFCLEACFASFHDVGRGWDLYTKLRDEKRIHRGRHLQVMIAPSGIGVFLEKRHLDVCLTASARKNSQLLPAQDSTVSDKRMKYPQMSPEMYQQQQQWVAYMLPHLSQSHWGAMYSQQMMQQPVNPLPPSKPATPDPIRDPAGDMPPRGEPTRSSSLLVYGFEADDDSDYIQRSCNVNDNLVSIAITDDYVKASFSSIEAAVEAARELRKNSTLVVKFA